MSLNTFLAINSIAKFSVKIKGQYYIFFTMFAVRFIAHYTIKNTIIPFRDSNGSFRVDALDHKREHGFVCINFNVAAHGHVYFAY